LCLTVLLASGCGRKVQPFSFDEPKMGTVFSITLYAEDSLKAHQAAYLAFARIDEINLALSDYSEESETWQLNAHQPEGWVPLSDDLATVLELSKQIANETNGAFDPTIGRLVQLWRRARRKNELPDSLLLKEALALSGFDAIVLADKRLRIVNKGMKLDFGGVGKGYAVDEALNVLKEQGYRRSFVSTASSIAVGDAPQDRPSWEFLMEEDLGQADGVSETIACNNCFIASSGDLFQSLELNGKRYSHIIDPSTGQALTNGAFTIVLAPSATLADAYSTAFSVMPVDEIKEFVKTHPDVKVKVWKSDEAGVGEKYSNL